MVSDVIALDAAPEAFARIRAGEVLKIVVSRDGRGAGKRAVADRE